MHNMLTYIMYKTGFVCPFIKKKKKTASENEKLEQKQFPDVKAKYLPVLL